MLEGRRIESEEIKMFSMTPLKLECWVYCFPTNFDKELKKGQKVLHREKLFMVLPCHTFISGQS